MRKTIVDGYGFIWVATQDGLNRFDGRTFVNTSSSDDVVGRSDIRDLFYDSTRKCIWALGGERQLFQISSTTGEVLQKYFVPKKSEDDWNICFAVVGHYIWIGCLSGVKLFDIHTSSFISIPLKELNATRTNEEIRCMILDRNSNLWLFDSWHKAIVIDPINVRLIKEYNFGGKKQKRNIVWDACNNGKNIVVATDEGVYKFTYPTYENINAIRPSEATQMNDPINGSPCYAIDNYEPGRFIIAGKGLYVADDSLNVLYTLSSSTPEDKDWLNSIRTMNSLNNGYVWLGSTQGLMRFSKNTSPFTSVKSISDKAKSISHVYSLLKAERVLYVNADDHLYAYTDGNLHEIAKGKGLLNLLSGPDNEIWISNAEGTKKLNGTGLESLRTEDVNYPVSMGRYNSSIISNQSLWLGTDNYAGLIHWDLKHNHIFNFNVHSTPPLFSNIVKNIYRDRDNGIWVLSDNVISYKKDGAQAFRRLSYASKQNNEYWMYFDMCETSEYYWIAIHHLGFIQIDKQLNLISRYTVRDGLCNSGVYKIFPIKDTALFITTNDGLSVFDIRKKQFRNYYESDGLHGNAFEETCGDMKDGLIYAGGVKGFTIIDPSKFTTNATPPKVYINRIFIDRANQGNDIDTANLELKELNVPNDVLQTTLYFSGINYSNPERTSFAYRIRENNNDWVHIGTQNYINLIGLSPGTYHLEVKAANEDGVWSRPVILNLIYLPKWYQTLWFKAALIISGIGIGYAIYKVRINYILKQQQIRKEVASDLHDDIGSTLNSVKVFAHLAMANPAHKEYILNVEENLEQVTIGLRDMIWVLDDNRDTISDLRDRLNHYAIKPAEAIGIKVHSNVADSIRHRIMSKAVKRNLYLIVKEAVNNSVKYAGCQNIWIDFYLNSRKLSVDIIDDGNGFDTITTTEGYGLSNIKSRAEQIQFECSIKSGANGTEIRLFEKKQSIIA